MEWRVAATTRATVRAICVWRHQSLRRGLAAAPLPTRRVADPAVHSEAPSESDVEVPAKAATGEKQVAHKPSQEVELFVPPKPPYSPSPKLESIAVSPPTDPILQQKRRHTTAAPNRAPPVDVGCAALDGTPWPDEREQEEDDKDYYSHHKASPLSEIEVVDTRKPITRASDGTADSNDEYFGNEVILWREEQLDTAEETLRRAMEIWKQSAVRGDPDSPHGRVLRTLRGEDW
ncbi:MRNA export factor like [Actinidia chinensis var. chinensis]|uniref:mRNA export factor like n=1 Tax=Actinidia chinensis var. chinensis TaxID=1590841 RepID=A0A2R6P5Q7_ACTCC|nr:MRNA export factor like [Actinidia chinensis var. chinensis]